jgi:CDP-glucose 4,6-dehydratase
VRDYFYVEDAVESYLHFAEQLDRPELHGQAFNFGNEKPITVIAMVDAILRVMDRADLKPVIQNEASHEIREQFLDCAKARKLLNWRAHYALEEGLRRTVAWYRRFLEAAAPAPAPVAS